MTLKFQMRIADMSWSATGITFWDGPQGVLVVPTNVTSNVDDVIGGVQIIDESLPYDTFTDGYTQSSITGNGFGVYFRINGNWWFHRF